MSATPRRVALVGNPNTGKTTLFNALTGFRARVGNYAGVTVERKSGPLKGVSAAVEIIDLPGTYSLAARSPDEMVAVEVLLGLREEEPAAPDLVAVVLDASNLERNLFLATQVFETGLPCVALLNMTDVAAQNGIKIDSAQLAERLGIPVFPIVAAKGTGIDAVRAYLITEEAYKRRPAAVVVYPATFGEALEKLTAEIASPESPAYLLRRSLLEANGMAEARLRRTAGEAFTAALGKARAALEAGGVRPLTLEAKARYGSIRILLDGVMTQPAARLVTPSDKLDRLLIHPVFGLMIFAVLMLIVFQAIYSWSGPFMDLIDGAFGALGDFAGASLPEGPLASFIQDGVIAGVGGVVIFLPQIIVLFFFISLLEDCGYMARAAFLMDRVLSRVGLSGRSFIPMLSSFACAIPGIMATRTIPDRRDRFATILLAPLMSCSARLPVYTIMIGAFVPEGKVLGIFGTQGLTLFAMYLVGPVVAVPVAMVLWKTLLRGPKPSFLMELPPYRLPDYRTVAHRLVERAGAFLKRAGTVIFAVSIVVWAATYYPRPAAVGEEIAAQYEPRIAAVEGEELATLEAERDSVIEGAYLRQSVLGRLGHIIEPAVLPLGWDWRIGMAVIASFPAREVVVATLGVIFDVGSDSDENSADLRSKLQSARNLDGSPTFTLPVALSIMVFFALCAQCAATLAVIRRETNSWRWPIFSFTYMTTLAWIAALIVRHVAEAVLGGA